LKGATAITCSATTDATAVTNSTSTCATTITHSATTDATAVTYSTSTCATTITHSATTYTTAVTHSATTYTTAVTHSTSTYTTAITHSATTYATAIACAAAAEVLSSLVGASTKLLPRFDRVVGAGAIEFLRRSLVAIGNPLAVLGIMLKFPLTLLIDLSPLL
jgi:hypothetical protein